MNGLFSKNRTLEDELNNMFDFNLTHFRWLQIGENL